MTEYGKSIESSRTINRQQEENQDKQYQEQGNHYYNNYNPARARACAREGATTSAARMPSMEDLKEISTGKDLPGNEIMEKIAQAYRDNIGPMITKAAAGIIERALRKGMEPATVILAIEETGMASRPSPYYLAAVIRNWSETGVVVSRARRELGVRQTDGFEPPAWWRRR